MRRLHLGLAIVALSVLGFANASFADGWGNIKGQVVWGSKTVPAAEKVNVNKDEQHCLSKGPILNDILVIDKDTGGVANVAIWLVPVTKGDKMPIHPDLKAVPKDTKIIDQPCCMFVPRVTMMREGQTLIIKNPAPVPHNSRLSGKVNGTKNPNLPPGGQIGFSGDTKLKAEERAMLLNCDIHGWMGGRVYVFDHPYFALTGKDGTFEIKNAPGGKYKIYIQHEAGGWVHKGKTSAGQVIDIPAGKTLDLGKYEMKIED
ncbi:MAG TPA: hypothetical protein VGZ47_13875 [Gemmataceae bacterium]|jgi:hypothetical protein|nr:hypothetical protein [Gemmataceae bacterium]